VSDQIILEMRGISKSFPGVHALDDVSFSVRKGEVHALVGENGAGKSTLMKILSGAYTKDQGEILLRGQSVEINGPSHAQALGISIIYQEFTLAPHLTAEANIFIGREPRTRILPFIDQGRIRAQATALVRELGVEIDVSRRVRDLNVSQQQITEIAKALSMNADIIIMDEPTSALAETEVATLFNAIRRLKDKGITFIYISHNLSEVFEISDRISVLRDGHLIGTEDTNALQPRDVIRMMVGRTLDDLFPKPQVQLGGPLLEVKHLSSHTKIQDVSFTLHRGEILGIAGLLGAGRTELMRLIFGADRPSAGEIWIEEKKVNIQSPLDGVKAGIGFVPEDRKQQGLFLGLAMRVNATVIALSSLTRFGFVSSSLEHTLTDESIASLQIKTSGHEQIVRDLSGGNQQKVVLAKWLAVRPKILILDDPTRGIDVGAKVAIHSLMGEFAKEGIGIILISSELPEVLGMSDRILVMDSGMIKGEFSREEATQEKIMACATGPRSESCGTSTPAGSGAQAV
jgi:ribose transport system ATP-binding protein